MDDVQAMEAMLLAESLNDSGTIDDLFEIDPDTRSIKVPSTELIFGVMTDQEAERKYFTCPKVIGDNIDLTKLTLTINYENANHERDKYIVDDVSIVGNTIIFSWLLSEKVLRYSGQVQFAICAVKTDENGVVEIAWNTTLTTGNVLGGLQVDDISGDEETESRDVLAQLLALMETNANENIQSVKDEGSSQIAAVQAEGATQMAAVEAKGVSTLATIPEDYTSMSAQVERNSRYLAPVIKQTVSGESIFVNDAAEMPVIGLNVYGKSDQIKTTGKNLLNIPESLHFDYIYGETISIPAGTYILSYSMEKHTGKYPPYVCFKTNNVGALLSSTSQTYTITLTEDETQLYIYSNNYGASESEGIYAWIYQLMLSVDGGEYEPYSNGISSPSPDCPQDITGVNSPVISISNTNIFAETGSYTARNITVILDNGVVSLTGESTTGYGVIKRYEGCVFFKPGITYTISSELHKFHIGFWFRDEYGVIIGTLSTESSGVYTLTIPDGVVTTDLFYAGVEAGVSVDLTDKFMVNVGEASLPFEKACSIKDFSVNTPNGLFGIKVPGEGNYVDAEGDQWICDEIDFERGVYIKRIKRFDISSYTNWRTWGANYQTEGLTGFYHYCEDLLERTCRCNILPYAWYAWGGKEYGAGAYANADDSYLVVSIPTDLLADTSSDEAAIASFTDFIANTDAYILASIPPVETPLSDEELLAYKALYSNHGNTVILSDSNAGMKVTYATDTKLYIDNKFTELQSTIS